MDRMANYKPDLTSFLDTIPGEVRGGILHHMEEVHTRNMEKVHLLDNIFKNLYSISAGLMKDGIEVTRGYSELATALNICQQQITWMCWLFIRPASSHKAGKPLGVKSSNAVSSAAGAPKKKSSKGSGRKTQGLPPHMTSPPFKPQPPRTSKPAPERPKVVFASTDARP